MSESSKLAQNKYRNRDDWVRKVINWKFYKKMKFHHTDKWDMHKTVRENETHKILWDFKIKMDPPVQVKKKWK